MRGGVLYINGQAVPARCARATSSRRRSGRRADPALRGDAAQRRQVHRARLGAERTVRQRRPLQGAGRPLLHDGRQPRQLHRQPRAVAALRRRLRAVREPGRPRRDHLLLGRRRRAERLPAGTPWTWPFDIRWTGSSRCALCLHDSGPEPIPFHASGCANLGCRGCGPQAQGPRGAPRPSLQESRAARRRRSRMPACAGGRPSAATTSASSSSATACWAWPSPSS